MGCHRNRRSVHLARRGDWEMRSTEMVVRLVRSCMLDDDDGRVHVWRLHVNLGILKKIELGVAGSWGMTVSVMRALRQDSIGDIFAGGRLLLFGLLG